MSDKQPAKQDVVTLRSKDGLSEKQVPLSTLGIAKNKDKFLSQVLNLPQQCNAKTVGLLAEYLVHHDGSEPPVVEKPLRSKRMLDVCPDPWDARFIDRVYDDGSREALFDMILLANSLGVNGLKHLGCAKVASLIKGRPLEEIKRILRPRGEPDPAAAAVLTSVAADTKHGAMPVPGSANANPTSLLANETPLATTTVTTIVTPAPTPPALADHQNDRLIASGPANPTPAIASEPANPTPVIASEPANPTPAIASEPANPTPATTPANPVPTPPAHQNDRLIASFPASTGIASFLAEAAALSSVPRSEQ